MPAYPGLPCVSIINYPNFCSYLICSRSPAYYGSDMTPDLAVNLLLDVRNGNYILRIFSRVHLRGNIGSFEEFRVLINNSFLGSKPCHGTKDLETPQFSAECAKMLPKGAEGDRCSNCLDQINLANVEPKRVKEEQGEDINVLEIFDEKPEELFNEDNSIYEEEDHQEIPGIIRDVLETNMKMDQDNQDEGNSVSTDDELGKTVCCAFCMRKLASSWDLGVHLLTYHAEQKGMLKCWFRTPGNLWKKAEILHSLKTRRRGEEDLKRSYDCN